MSRNLRNPVPHDVPHLHMESTVANININLVETKNCISTVGWSYSEKPLGQETLGSSISDTVSVLPTQPYHLKELKKITDVWARPIEILSVLMCLEWGLGIVPKSSPADSNGLGTTALCSHRSA